MLSEQDKKDIVLSIEEAEQLSTGEIRIHLCNQKIKSPMERATQLFFKLKMDQTHERNGVLIYVNFKQKQIAILGDEGINTRVPFGFWDDVYAQISMDFKTQEFKKGLITAVHSVGEKLSAFFPPPEHSEENKDELSNEISEE